MHLAAQKKPITTLILNGCSVPGAVKSIELQPEFVLQPAYEIAGKKIRPIIYRADFKVTEADGHIYYVDTKGMRTQVYLLKKKMLLYKYPDIDFREE